jgi:hypothetical protein
MDFKRHRREGKTKGSPFVWIAKDLNTKIAQLQYLLDNS